MATDYEGIISPDKTTHSSTEELTTPRFMNMVTDLHKTRPTAQTPQLVLQTRRFRRVLAGLRNEWDQVRPYRHAQTTGLVLGQMALNPKAAATTVLTETVNYVVVNGPYGIDGILLTALSAAQWLNPAGFAEALSRLGQIYSQPIQNPKGKLGIFFYDLGLGGPRAMNTLRGQTPLRTENETLTDYTTTDTPFTNEQRFDARRTAQTFTLPSNLMISAYPDSFRNLLFTTRTVNGSVAGLEQAATDERGFGAGVRNLAYQQPRIRNWAATSDHARTLIEDGCLAMTWTVNVLQLALRSDLLGQTAPRQINRIPDGLIAADNTQLHSQTTDLWITGIVYEQPETLRTHTTTVSDNESTHGIRRTVDTNDTTLKNSQTTTTGSLLNRTEAEIEHDLDPQVQDLHPTELGLVIAPDETRAYPVAEETRRRTTRPGTVVLNSITRLAATGGHLLYPAPEPLGNGLYLMVNPLKLNQNLTTTTHDTSTRPLRLSDEDIDRIVARIAGTINRPQA